MKKIIIIYLLFNILLFCGCEINDLNNTKVPSKLTVSDIKQLIGITYEDVGKIYGSPAKSTYYIKIDDLSSINPNYINLRHFNHYSIVKAYYNINNDGSYIVLWYKDNKVIKSSFYEIYTVNEDYLDMYINDIDIKIDYNKNNSNLNDNLIKSKYRNYIGDDIKQFNNKYNLICPKIEVNLYHKNKILYFYDIKNKHDEYANSNSLFIVCDNNIITNIIIIKSSTIYEAIINYVK